eukprot:1180103-Prorocentrum_minimum.AAC.1
MIKLHAWEGYFRAKVDARRAEEYATLRRVTALNCVNIFLLWISPQLVSISTFTVWELGFFSLVAPRSVGAALAFTALATFRQLQEPVRTFPTVIANLVMASVSLRRIQRFLVAEELQPGAVFRPLLPPPHPLGRGRSVAVQMEGAAFRWSEKKEEAEARGGAEAPPTLSDISLQVRLCATVPLPAFIFK